MEDTRTHNIRFRLVISQGYCGILPKLENHILALYNIVGKICDDLYQSKSLCRWIISHTHVTEGVSSLDMLQILCGIQYYVIMLFQKFNKWIQEESLLISDMQYFVLGERNLGMG